MSLVLDLVRTGIALHQRGDRFGARLHYLAALREDPSCLAALQNLGQLANDANELSAAVAFVRRILHKVPHDGIQWSNLGNLLTRKEEFDAAEIAMVHAATLVPDLPVVWHNWALLRLRQRDYTGALEFLEKAERLGQRSLTLQNDKAHVLLHLGRLDTAWPLYEARWEKLVHLPPWDFHIPEWKGEDLKDKSILIHGEQGFGDTLMWLRFARRFRYCSRLVLGVPRCMVSLVEHMGLVASAIEDMCPETMSGFDFHSPMYSTLRWLNLKKKEIFCRPYIHGLALQTWNENFRVGICWASGRRNTEHDWRGRYSNFKDWLSLAEINGIELISLQQGPDADAIAGCSAEGLVDDSEISRAKTWLDTAKIIANLDLVICVDTAVAHLAGAMGKSVWMLSQYTNCWRWWDIENGTGWPWYRTMKILRQPKPGDWASLLVQCKNWLEEGKDVRKLAA